VLKVNGRKTVEEMAGIVAERLRLATTDSPSPGRA